MKKKVDPESSGKVDLPEFLALMNSEYKQVDAEKELLEAFKTIQGEESKLQSTRLVFMLTQNLGNDDNPLTEYECK